MKPLGTENPKGWKVKLEKPCVGGMDIFWNHTIRIIMLWQKWLDNMLKPLSSNQHTVPGIFDFVNELP